MTPKLNSLVFPTKYSESVKKGTFEAFTKPSMTEPDNALSIPEIIARFTRGYGIPVEQHEWTQGSATEGGVVYDDLADFFGSYNQQALVKEEPAKQEPAKQEPAKEEPANQEPAPEA